MNSTASLAICRQLLSLALLVPLLLATHSHVAADIRQPPGTRVQLDVPAEYEISKLFTGLIHPIASLSVVVNELPGSRYEQIAARLSDDALKRKGLVVTKRGRLGRTDKHTYLLAEQRNGSEVVNKYVLLIGDQRTAAIITVNVPKESIAAGFASEADILASLKTAKLVQKAAPLDTPYTIGNSGAFKQAGRLPGNAVLYTTNGQLRPSKPGEMRSLIVVASSIDRVAVTDLTDFATRALDSLQGYDNVSVDKIEETSVAGLKGVQMTAQAVSAQSKGAVDLRQLVLARSGGGYFKLLAIVQKGDAETLSPDVETFFASFKPKD